MKKIKRPISPVKALELMDDFVVWPMYLVDYQALHEAGTLCQKLKLSFWDSLILVAARWSGAETVYTEDLDHNQTIYGVHIVNPFLEPS